METFSGKPYREFNLLSDDKLRLFKEEIDESELIWHRDRNDRDVCVMDGVGWKLQLDNELPFELKIGETYRVPKMVFHRLLKGKGNLVIRVRDL